MRFLGYAGREGSRRIKLMIDTLTLIDRFVD